MVNASKILTVSYGTFSCTLEGFDNPFSTMRSIAEYFRDLAADDRYFGAEPPTPDADMLHRIAEREINRRVEARVKKNGIVLRQIEDDSLDGGADEPEAEPAPVARKAKPPAPKPAPRREPEAEAEAPRDIATGETVAEKLRRIRAAVARGHVEPQFSGAFAEDENAAEIHSGQPIETAFAEDGDVQLAEPEAAATPEADMSDNSDETETAAEQEAQEDAPAVIAEADEETAPDVAEVAEPEVAEVAEPEVGEEAEPEVAETDEPEVAEQEDLAAEQEEPVAAQPEPEVAEQEEPEVAAAEDAAAAAEEDAPFVLTGKHSAAAVAQNMEDDESFEPVEEEAAAGSPDLDLAALFDDEAEARAEDEAVAGQPSDDEAEVSAEVADAEPAVARARIVKMRRQEFMELYVAEDETDAADEAEAQEDAADSIRQTLGDTGLSAEDEDELVNDLIAADRDMAETGEAVEEAEDKAADTFEPLPEQEDLATDEIAMDGALEADEKDEPSEEPRIKSAEEIAESLAAAVSPDKDKDLSVDRLLRQADSQLNDSDGSRRRSAIAHLKAAVAAVRADGNKTRKDSDAETERTMDQFRSDLAQVVRPEMGASEDGEDGNDGDAALVKPERSGPSRPAISGDGARSRRRMPPLMLVSEQRVDKPDSGDADTAPVRPRRVRSEDDEDLSPNALFDEDEESGEGEGAGNMFGDAKDFRAFVAEHGAEGVDELLEASVAFGTLVEGAPFNSRPQIMQRMLRFVPQGTVTREEGLRTFGVLLREGRIHRVKRGQFVLPEKSRYKQELRKAAG